MSPFNVLLGVLLVFVLILAGYVGYRFLSFQLDKHWQAPVKVQPVISQAPVQRVPEQGPSRLWWDELEALRSEFARLQIQVKGELTDADNKLKLARASEERTRKQLREAGMQEEGQLPALPAMQPGGWENDVPAPAQLALNHQLLDKRRRA